MSRCASHRVMAGFIVGLAGVRRQQGNTTDRWRDKRASPVDSQSIDMAWLSPCRMVGPRAAPGRKAYDFKDVFGTARYLPQPGSRL